MKKIAFVYLPTGHTLQYTTADLGDNNYHPAAEITKNADSSLTIQTVDVDGTVEHETIVGIPYLLQEWEEAEEPLLPNKG